MFELNSFSFMSLDCLIGELSQKNKIKCLPQDPCPVAQNPLQEYLGTLKIQQVKWSISKANATMWALGFAHAVAELLLPRVWHNASTSAILGWYFNTSSQLGIVLHMKLVMAWLCTISMAPWWLLCSCGPRPNNPCS